MTLSDSKNLSGALSLSSKFISPFNSLILLSLTLIDLFTPSLDKTTSKLIAIVLGVILLLFLHQVSLVHKQQAQTSPPEIFLKLFFRNKLNLLTTISLAIVLLFFWYSVARASTNGIIADTVPGVKTAQATLLGIHNNVAVIKSDIDEIRRVMSPTDARGKLRALGFALNDESKALAIENCDLEALRLYVEAGENLPIATPIFGLRGGSNLEKPIMSNNPRAVQMIDILAKQGVNFDRRFMLTFTQAQTSEIPKFSQLISKIPVSQRFGLLPSSVRANALVVAIWSGNEPVQEKLTSLGADQNVGVEVQVPEIRNGTNTGQMIVRQIATAQSEQKRLSK